MTEVAAVLARLGDRVELDAPIAPLTTYGVGGRAAGLVRCDGPADLEAIGSTLAGTDVPILLVGRGSNLLVHDRGFPGVVVVLGEGFADVEVDGTTIRAGGAASLPVVARRSAAAALTGFEWAVGVPGSIGGAVRMNAGGHGSDMAACVASAEVVDLRKGTRERRTRAELCFDYRTSSIAADEVVLAAEIVLERGDRAASEAAIADIVRWRREHQPGGHNAGSVFVNPPGDSAGRLIEAAGCKGTRVGSAAVSTKHANFIQADGGGTAADVHELMELVRHEVRAKTGVTLVAETRLVGFGPPSGTAGRGSPGS